LPQGQASRVLVQRVACSNSRPVGCIRHAAVVYRQSFRLLLAVAWCESRLNPYARNPSGASGLFQFMPSTWRTTPYRWRSIWSARWQAMAAGWMFAHGRAREWSCLYLI
jgi:soluble lytic murein transglycosylase-like protein